MKANYKLPLVLAALLTGLIACSDNPENGTMSAVKIPDFAKRINNQNGIDFGGVFVVVTVNGIRNTVTLSSATAGTESIQIAGIKKGENNALKLEWFEIFQGANLALSRQEGILFVASTDSSSAVTFAHLTDEFDDDDDGKSNLIEREQGTCPVVQNCTIVPPNMITIETGEFIMGASVAGFEDDEYPQRRVSVDAFTLSEAEITWGDWDVCVDAGGCTQVEVDPRLSAIDNLRSHPLGGVTYDQIQDYLTWINGRLSGGYRLPSEAEFEYALRAGSTNTYPYGEGNAVGNYCDFLNGFNGPDDCEDGYQWTSPVRTFPPNSFGLYDMNGNIFEWTADCWHENFVNAPSDARAWRAEEGGDCGHGVMRGGNFYFDSKEYHSSNRRKKTTYFEFATFIDGFRLAR